MSVLVDGWDSWLDAESRRGYLPLSLPARHDDDQAVSVASLHFSGSLHSSTWTIGFYRHAINWNINTKSIAGEFLNIKDLVVSEL
jgi:hypothetical protein